MTQTIETPGGFIRTTGTEARVCALIARRQGLGINKYGTTVQDNPLDAAQWLQHLIEELADALVYASRLREEMIKGMEDGK